LKETNERSINLIEESNCLALTVQKDYKIVAAKKIFIKTFNSIYRICISWGTISFINFFL